MKITFKPPITPEGNKTHITAIERGEFFYGEINCFFRTTTHVVSGVFLRNDGNVTLIVPIPENNVQKHMLYHVFSIYKTKEWYCVDNYVNNYQHIDSELILYTNTSIKTQ